MVFGVLNKSAGALVFGRETSATFEVYNGVSESTGQTTFTLQNGQFATLKRQAPAAGRCVSRSFPT